MLSNFILLKHLWGEAVKTTSLCPLIVVNSKTLYEVWLGKLTNYSHLRLFGYVRYVYVSEGKLNSRSNKCEFIGYPKRVKDTR